MILRRSPNGWSCLPTAFAMAMDLEPCDVIRHIGHDGSNEPYKEGSFKAGFHEQECIEVAQRLGFVCTPIEAVPTISPHLDGRDARPIYFGDELADNWTRFLRHLDGTCGVFTGTYTLPGESTPFQGHAVAWDGVTTRKIHDSKGLRCYPLEKAAKYGFTPGCFWKVQYVKVHG